MKVEVENWGGFFHLEVSRKGVDWFGGSVYCKQGRNMFLGAATFLACWLHERPAMKT